MHTALASRNQTSTPSRAPTTARAHPSIRNILRGPTIQPKLKIGAANDPAEREADAVADRVMRMSAPEPSAAGEGLPPPPGNGSDSPPAMPPSNPSSGPNPIRRLCEGCADELQRQPIDEDKDELEVQRQPIDEEKDELEVQRMAAGEGAEVEEEELIQPKETPGATPALSAASESAIRGLGGGAPLARSERAFFEPRFGRDFSDVRVHSGAAADSSARSINARAYTFGSDIAFAKGEYTPGTPSGRRLLAHELTHTVQQRSNQLKHTAQTKSLVTPAPLTLQRSFLPISPTSLIGNFWLKLPKALKARLVDKAIEANLRIVDKFPGKAVFGELWIFMKEGLIGFYEKLKSAKEQTKILVTDKIARIMAGQSSDYALGLLKGLLIGFFVDGLLGVFLAIWGLIKWLGNLWSFFGAVGKLIKGFPNEIAKLIQGFRNLGQEISANIKPAIEEFTKFIFDPSQTSALVAMIVEKGKSKAKEAGGEIAESLLSFFSKPGAEASVGEIAGRGIGKILFEVVFAILTFGGGLAVTGIKAAAKFLATIGGKLIGSVLKVFRKLRGLIGFAADVVRRAASFLKGKVLGKITGKLGNLLERVNRFIKLILKSCRESRLVCKFKLGITSIKGVPFRHGWPVFDKWAKVDLRIPPSVWKIQDRGSHMREATRKLRRLIEDGTVSRRKFTKVQREAIKGGKAKIPGLTWHHHQYKGRMQLIPTSVHSVSHHGGYWSWYR